MIPPWLIVPIIYGVYKLLTKYDEASNTPTPPVLPVVGNRICLIGKTGTGKSSTANALLGHEAFAVGAKNGSTAKAIEVVYKNNFTIVDTPGLLDTINHENTIIYELARSKIILYVTSGQLFQTELDFLYKIRNYHLQSNQKIILYVNQQDTRERTMPTQQREIEKNSIKNQVISWLPEDKIVFGSASPVKNGALLPPSISELNNLISKMI